MQHKNLLITLLSIFSLITVSAQNKQNAVKTFISNEKFRQSGIGICVKDLSGNTIASHNAEKSLTPASIQKIITTATALEILGADFRYKTTLGFDKKNQNCLIIKGLGDPTLGSDYAGNNSKTFLEQWSDTIIKALGSKKNIDITIIDNYFGYEGISRKWIWEDMGNYFAAGCYGISIYDNTFKLVLNTMRRDTCPIIVKTEPRMNLQFTNSLNHTTKIDEEGYILGEPLSSKRWLIGNIPTGKSSYLMKADIPNPGLLLAEELRSSLLKKSISIKNIDTSYKQYNKERFAKNKTTYASDVFYTHISAPLSNITREINVKSNNHFAEHLLRTVGRTANEDIYSSALDEGLEKVRKFWIEKGIKDNALFMYDGSGLSPSNAVSPEFMCDVLLYMQNESKNAEVFLNSIPKAGKEGTVRNFLKGSRLEGKVYAKSGTLKNVRCFAGYYINGNQKYAFCVMVNNFNCQHRDVTKEIVTLLLNLF